jgi:hypothetical protein
MYHLLSNINGNHKLKKTNKLQSKYLATILHLKPCSKICPNATNGCKASCLNTSGFGRYGKTQQARQKRTDLWLNNKNQFKKLLILDIIKFCRYCKKRRKVPAIRLNGTSDIKWESEYPELFSLFHNAVFYDYTKDVNRCTKKHRLPNNYHLILSRSESNQLQCLNILRTPKGKICVVFPKGKLLKNLWGHSVINGDKHDLIFLHPPGIIGVSAKGRARRDLSGFVYRKNL